jgi:hypothetical protein
MDASQRRNGFRQRFGPDQVPHLSFHESALVVVDILMHKTITSTAVVPSKNPALSSHLLLD